MSVQDYINAGFQVGAHVDAGIVERAERDAIEAYMQPIIGDKATADYDTQEKECLMNVTYLLLLERSTFATMSGAKFKLTDHSRQAAYLDAVGECSATCGMKLRALMKKNGKNWNDVTDICGIRLKTNYFGL